MQKERQLAQRSGNLLNPAAVSVCRNAACRQEILKNIAPDKNIKNIISRVDKNKSLPH